MYVGVNSIDQLLNPIAFDIEFFVALVEIGQLIIDVVVKALLSCQHLVEEGYDDLLCYKGVRPKHIECVLILHLHGVQICDIEIGVAMLEQDAVVSVTFLHIGAGEGAQRSEQGHVLGSHCFQQRLKFGDQPVEGAGIAEYRDGAVGPKQCGKGCPQRCECILKGREQAEGKQDIFCLGISAAK